MASTQPDRQFPLEIQIKESEISLAAGSTSKVSITLINQGVSNEAMEIHSFGIPAEWVSGICKQITLAAGEEQSFELDFNIPADAQFGRFPFDIQVTSQIDSDMYVRTSLIVTVTEPEITTDENRIDILLGTKDYSVAPGFELSIPIIVVNQGQQANSYNLSLKGIPDDWVSSPETMVHLQPGEQRSINLIIQPPQPLNSHATRLYFRIMAKGYQFTDDVAEVECKLTVAAYEVAGLVDLLLGSRQYAVEPGSEVNILVTLINQSSVMDTFHITLEGLPSKWILTTGSAVLLLPGQETIITLSIRPPRNPMSHAGWIEFKICVESLQQPNHPTEAKCKLIIKPFYVFSGFIRPGKFKSGELSSINIKNQGNTNQTYQIAFISEDGDLEFTIIRPPNIVQSRDTPPTAVLSLETPFNIGQPPELSISGGEVETLMFKARPRWRPLIGNEVFYPFITQITTYGENTKIINGVITAKAWMPLWLFTISLLFFLAVCLIFAGIRFLNIQNPQASRVTQTAAYYQTLQASITVAAPTSTMSLTLGPDTDGDGLSDLDESSIGTDPLNPDTDSDQLLDSQESLPCPDPLNPDSDGDGIVDGVDQDPCDHNNPLPTPGAGEGIPTSMPVLPTVTVPPFVTPPTQTP